LLIYLQTINVNGIRITGNRYNIVIPVSGNTYTIYIDLKIFSTFTFDSLPIHNNDNKKILVLVELNSGDGTG
jgi:hypothetical protein